ncbi:MAG: DUF308 domain-containing protein [Methylococcales bacterium]|nr:DUF308 domain-containing protein [Methylococcales bacterium]
MNEETSENVGLGKLQQNIHKHIQSHWKPYAAEGILFVILGVGLNIAPLITHQETAATLGGLLLMAGLVQIVRSLRFIDIAGFNLFLFTGLLQLSIGFYFFAAEPIKAKITLAMLLVIFFGMESAVKVLLAFMMRPLARWDAMLFSGIASIVLVLALLTSWPKISITLFVLLLGMNMIFFGSALLNIIFSNKTTGQTGCD